MRGLTEVFMQPAMLRQILGDFTKPLKRSQLVAQSGDRSMGPKSAAILAQLPALVFGASFGRRSKERIVGLATMYIFRRITSREMLTNHLVSRVALQPAGACVPRQNEAVHIHRGDRKAFLGFNEKTR